jgi:virginiamycin B lyase
VPGACVSGYSCPLVPRPQSITLGPDGALWFTEQMFSNVAVRTTAGKVVRMTTAGAFTEFSLPGGATKSTTPTPGGIASGSDGALWFTDAREGKIWRSTTSGALTSYAIPIGTASAITTGPDAALWFVGAYGSGGVLGRITTSGAFLEFTIPPGPDGISLGTVASGKDGNIWFTKYDMLYSRGVITRSTLAGVMTDVPRPTYEDVDGLAPGPDGAMWFSDTNNQSGTSIIGRMSTS